MATAFAPDSAPTQCPSCDAKIRLRAPLPDGSPLRCPECEISFYYRSAPQSKTSGKPPRRKQVSCPRCSGRFIATIADGHRVQCPECHARMSIRKSGAKVVKPAPTATVAAQRAPKKTRLDFSPLEALAPPAAMPATRKKSGFVPGAFGQKPRRSRSGPRVYTINLTFVVALLLLVAAGYFAWSLYFGEVKRETVKGIVTFEGKLLACGSVVMQGEDGVSNTGAINPDGTYSVAKVPRGKVRVAVISMRPLSIPSDRNPDDPEANNGPADGPMQGWFPIPEIYGNINRPIISVTVGAETTFDIELKNEDAAAESIPADLTAAAKR